MATFISSFLHQIFFHLLISRDVTRESRTGFWNLDSRLNSVDCSPVCICGGSGFMAGTGKRKPAVFFLFYGVLQIRMACETSTLKNGGGRIERLEEEEGVGVA